MDISQIVSAKNLSERDKELVHQLACVYKKKLARNKLKMKYYEDKTRARNLGLTVPADIARNVDVAIGWCAKSVDMLAARSQYDGMNFRNGTSEELNAILDTNDMALKYASAIPSELVHSCGFWTVNNTEDGVCINYHDAVTAAGLWDYAKARIKAGLTIADFDYNQSGIPEPSKFVLYTDDEIVEIFKVTNGWEAVAHPTLLGRPSIEPMCYRPSNERPFGKSRVSRACMAITDEMQREIVRTALSSELFSAPQKYLLGASEENFDKSKFSLYLDAFLVTTRDENGELPQLGQLAQASMEPHISVMENLMSRMAAETSCPVAAFGLSSNGYTSSDALRASTDDLIIEAEALNRSNGKALRNVALLAMAIDKGVALKDLTDDERSVAVQWKNPAMPSIASQTDAMVKQASVCDWLPDTDVYWEQLGYSEEQRRRIKSERTSAQASQQISAVLGFSKE